MQMEWQIVSDSDSDCSLGNSLIGVYPVCPDLSVPVRKIIIVVLSMVEVLFIMFIFAPF